MTALTTRPTDGGASSPRRDGPAALRALLVTVTSAAAVVVTYLLFVHTAGGQHLDQAALNHLADGTASRLAVAAWLRDITVGLSVVILGSCVVVAVLRRRLMLGVLAVGLVAGANLTTQLLKHVIFQRPHLEDGWANSLPSGHATIVTSLAFAALLVAPSAWRGFVTLVGAVVVTVAGIGTVVANWHRPSDVAAALAVTLAWGALALAVASWTTVAPPPTRPARTHPLALITGLALGAGFFLEVGVRPDGTSRDLMIHVVIMCGIAILGAVVVGAFARMVNARIP